MLRNLKTLIILTSVLFAVNALAAVGCSLNDPDRDIKRIFPQSTGYKTEFITIEERGGSVLAKEIKAKLGDTFDTVYETRDVPYAYYTVLKGKETIGYVHGVNQKGTYGGMQIILTTDLNGEIIDFYFQRISSPEAKRFRDKVFTEQFIGLTLADFANNTEKVKGMRDPSKKSKGDFLNTLRGTKKNLIIFEAFNINKTGGHYEAK